MSTVAKAMAAKYLGEIKNLQVQSASPGKMYPEVDTMPAKGAAVATVVVKGVRIIKTTINKVATITSRGAARCSGFSHWTRRGAVLARSQLLA